MSFNMFQPVVLFSKGNASSVTGTITETTLASFTIKAGMVSKNDYLEVYCDWSYPNSATNKTMIFKIGATNFIASVATTTVSLTRHVEIGMRSVLNSQVSFPKTGVTDFGSSASAPTTGAEDFSTDLTAAFNATLVNIAETITLESAFVILWKEQNPL